MTIHKSINTPGKFQMLADRFKEPVEVFLPRIVNEQGVVKAARVLEVSESAVRYQLRKRGFISAYKQVWIPREEAEGVV